MIQRSGIAVVTICRDDAFFLQRFVDYYGGLFGRRHLYVISHGDTDMVRQVAEGTNIFPVPAIKTSKFNMLHWRTKNGLLSALRQWYAHVIVVDVDEFIVVDPATGHNLKSWLETAKTGTVYSPFGLEPVHLRSKEPDPVSDHIIGPRMHAQVAFHYAKPCIISTRAHLSRGGHYSQHKHLNMPDFLYLFHMRFCDWDVFRETADRRNAVVAAQQELAGGGKINHNPNWKAENRQDEKTFSDFEAREIRHEFDFADIRAQLKASWGPRGENLYHFKRLSCPELYRLPDRFAGVDRAP